MFQASSMGTIPFENKFTHFMSSFMFIYVYKVRIMFKPSLL